MGKILPICCANSRHGRIARVADDTTRLFTWHQNAAFGVHVVRLARRPLHCRRAAAKHAVIERLTAPLGSCGIILTVDPDASGTAVFRAILIIHSFQKVILLNARPRRCQKSIAVLATPVARLAPCQCLVKQVVHSVMETTYNPETRTYT